VLVIRLLGTYISF